jgi:hypothetical protein
MDNGYFLTRDAAAVAVDILRPTILDFLTRRAKRPCLHLVILDPRKPYDKDMDTKSFALYEESFGGEKWGDETYDKFAQGKARMCLRTGLPSWTIVHEYPHLLERGDPKYGGGVIFNKIIVGVSGIDESDDIMIATWVASTCAGLCRRKCQVELLGRRWEYVP